MKRRLLFLFVTILSTSIPALAQFKNIMTVESLQHSSAAMSRSHLVLTDSVRTVTISCKPSTQLSITEQNVTQLYQAKDFYSYGCYGFIKGLLALGVAMGSQLWVKFYGANVYPGLIVDFQNTSFALTPQSNGSEGVFTPRNPDEI